MLLLSQNGIVVLESILLEERTIAVTPPRLRLALQLQIRMMNCLTPRPEYLNESRIKLACIQQGNFQPKVTYPKEDSPSRAADILEAQPSSVTIREMD